MADVDGRSAIVADSRATVLDCTPLRAKDDGSDAVMLWLDFAGATFKLALSGPDAERLHALLGESLRILDDDVE